MIMYQLFEHQPPFAGTDPVEAARKAALQDLRPGLNKLNGTSSTAKVGLSALIPLVRHHLGRKTVPGVAALPCNNTIDTV